MPSEKSRTHLERPSAARFVKHRQTALNRNADGDRTAGAYGESDGRPAAIDHIADKGAVSFLATTLASGILAGGIGDRGRRAGGPDPLDCAKMRPARL